MFQSKSVIGFVLFLIFVCFFILLISYFTVHSIYMSMEIYFSICFWNNILDLKENSSSVYDTHTNATWNWNRCMPIDSRRDFTKCRYMNFQWTMFECEAETREKNTHYRSEIQFCVVWKLYHSHEFWQFIAHTNWNKPSQPQQIWWRTYQKVDRKSEYKQTGLDDKHDVWLNVFVCHTQTHRLHHYQWWR